MLAELTILPFSALTAAALTGLVRRLALAVGMVDVPGPRSSHVTPTARGGGLAIALVIVVGTLVLERLDSLSASTAIVLVLAGSAVAAVGYIDDRRGLSARSRLLVHIPCCALTLFAFGAVGCLDPNLAWLVVLLGALAMTWYINLFNFMDGIDGLAASEAVFIAGSSAALAALRGDTPLATPALLVAGTCLGFLFWNRPPAKIFMGDVGSGFLGYWLAALAYILDAHRAVDIWTSLILVSVFLSDATSTLLRRMTSGARWYEAHRAHLYQQLARRWRSHGRVTGALWVINLGAILPLALTAHLCPSVAPALALATIATLCLLALLAGAGRSEETRAQPQQL